MQQGQRRRSSRREEQKAKKEQQKQQLQNVQQIQELQMDVERSHQDNIDQNDGLEQVRQLMENVLIPNQNAEILEQPQIQQQQQQQPQQQHQQQQQRPQQQNLSKINPKRFLAKIPNTSVMRDFFINQGKYYVPPKKDLTSAFCRDILAGKKKLMKLNQVLWVEEVPRWPEFTAKQVWAKGENNPAFKLYFPDYGNNSYPQRKYLLNIANTIAANSVVEAVIQIRAQREKKVVEDEPIMMTNEFIDLFNQFQAISTDQTQSRMRLTTQKVYDQCPLCLLGMKKVSASSSFHCNNHKAHTRCVMKYYNSEIGINSQYACPLRCPKEQNF